jgi:hypothetical protein
MQAAQQEQQQEEEQQQQQQEEQQARTRMPLALTLPGLTPRAAVLLLLQMAPPVASLTLSP